MKIFLIKSFLKLKKLIKSNLIIISSKFNCKINIYPFYNKIFLINHYIFFNV